LKRSSSSRDCLARVGERGSMIATSGTRGIRIVKTETEIERRKLTSQAKKAQK
jgi:hypothetical protein